MTQTSKTRSLELERTFAADPAAVFGAWSRADAVRRWMGPGDDLQVTVHRWEFHPGGAFRIEMNNREGEAHIVGGRFQTVDPPSRLVFSWAWESEIDMITQVTVDLAEVEGGTRLRLRHEGFVDEETRALHEKGWSGTLDRLTRYLA